MMHFIKAVVALLSLVAAVLAHHGGSHEGDQVNVDVYYESMCPDSIAFFTQQLYPSLQGNLSSYVNLTLLPYGKSTTKREVPDQPEFTCHHGPAECNGNRLHACALHDIDGGRNSEGLGYNKIATGFINCLMDKLVRKGDETKFPTNECATINHVPDYKQIENCANSPEGSKYLDEAGIKTQALTPKLTSVPTIVFNNQFKDEDNKLAQSNFVKALCQYIQKDKHPAECSRNSANTFRTAFVLVAIMSAISFLY